MKHRLGFRFRPNDEQLIEYYLKRKLLGLHSEVDQSIAEVNFLKHEPWDLPAFSKENLEDQFWYFSYRLDHKSKGVSRKTVAGYWKATGKDRNVRSRDTNKHIGIKKTLVFHQGRVSKKVKGVRTNWVMHEYHIITDLPNPKNYVICRLKKKADGKASSLAPEEVESSHQSSCQLPSGFGSHVALTHDDIESSRQSPSDFGNPVAEVDPPPQADPGVFTDCDELHYELIPELTTLLNPEDGLSLQDLPSSNSDCNWVQTQFGPIEAPSSINFNSNCNGVQNQFGTIEPPSSNIFSRDFNGFQTQFDNTEPPSSNSFSSDCNLFQTQFATTELGEDFAFSDSFYANECNAYLGETSSHKNSVAESDCLNWNWDFNGMSVAHLLESFRGRSYNGGMISDANHEVAIEQAREAVEHVISSDLNSEVELEYIPGYITAEPYFYSTNSPTTNKF